MRRRTLLAASIFLPALLAQAPRIPDTPAGRQFSGWLQAFNEGNRGKLETFLNTHFAKPRPVDNALEFREETGGFDLLSINEAGPFKVTGMVKERDSDTRGRFEMAVEAEPPHKIAAFSIRATPDAAPAERMDEASAIAALKQEVAKRAAADRFSGAVLVAKGGKTLYGEAKGMADREQKIANRLDTRFRIGSMNKMFTAVATAQLAQAGKIKFTDPVGKYITDYPNKELASKVTIHHLLTHTGGTGDFFGPLFDKHRKELKDLKDYVALYGTRGLEFEPGSRWQYSNYGFLLLGILIERVSGQSYYDYVREHVFKPAGMTRTDSLPEAEEVKDRATGYMKRAGVWVPNTDTLPVRGTSAGGGYSTVEDLVRFAEALRAHKLLNAEYTKLVTTAQADTPDGGKYGYGFGISKRWYGHGGGAPGMNGELKIDSQNGYVIAVLANMDPPAAGRLADFIANRLP